MAQLAHSQQQSQDKYSVTYDRAELAHAIALVGEQAAMASILRSFANDIERFIHARSQ